MIELEFYIPEPTEKVWEHLTLEAHLKKWWTEKILLEPRIGGKFVERWEDAGGCEQTVYGRITAFEPGKRLQLEWQQPDWIKPTRVEILLKPTNVGTTIYLQHSGWGIFDDDQEKRRQIVDLHTSGWAALLEKLTKYSAQEGKG